MKSPEDDPVNGASTDRPFIHFDKVVKRYGELTVLDHRKASHLMLRHHSVGFGEIGVDSGAARLARAKVSP